MSASTPEDVEAVILIVSTAEVEDGNRRIETRWRWSVGSGLRGDLAPT